VHINYYEPGLKIDAICCIFLYTCYSLFTKGVVAYIKNVVPIINQGGDCHGMENIFSSFLLRSFFDFCSCLLDGNYNLTQKAVAIEEEITIIQNMSPEMVKQKTLDQLAQKKEEYRKGIRIEW